MCFRPTSNSGLRATRGPAGLLHSTLLALLAPLVLTAAGAAAQERPLFSEDFEAGLERWSFPIGDGHEIVEVGGAHGHALALVVRDVPVYALIEGSEAWGDVRIEGDVLFPSEDDSYLGFIYRYREGERRIDFGSLYIKNNGNYVQANEHHDTDVGRTFWPELRSPLEGERAIEIGTWQRFALEVVGGTAHLYVGDFDRPVITLPAAPHTTGGFGFKPRNPGTPVWIDDIVVEPLAELTYTGPPVPDPGYDRNAWVTDWSVLGPLTRHVEAVERGRSSPSDAVEDDGRRVSWRPAPADHRGAVVTGRVVETRGARRVAYYRADVVATAESEGVLVVSTVDDLAIWVNGVFVGFTGQQAYAWWDALENPEHPPLRVPISLREGSNQVIVRTLGGVYATGGFYLAVRADGG